MQCKIGFGIRLRSIIFFDFEAKNLLYLKSSQTDKSLPYKQYTNNLKEGFEFRVGFLGRKKHFARPRKHYVRF